MLTRNEIGCGCARSAAIWLDEPLDDERLAAGEGELLDADRDGLVDQRLEIGERDAA